MSLLHEAIVAEKYGLRLTMDQLGKALCLAPQTMDGFIGWCVVYDSLVTHLAIMDNDGQAPNIRLTARTSVGLGLPGRHRPTSKPRL